MTEIEQMLQRQARWQQSRAALSWAEKLRLAETLRDAALALSPDPRKASASPAEVDATPTCRASLRGPPSSP